MNKIIAILLFCLICLHAKSQNLSYGIGIGTSFSTISDLSFDLATAPKGAGFLFYAQGDYFLKNDKFSINGKLGLDNRKVIYYVADYEEYKVDINFLTFSPALKIDLDSQSRKGAYFRVGGRFSSILKAKERETNEDITDNFKSSNLGFNLGLGVDITNSFGLELILDFGITDEIKNSDSSKKINSALVSAFINLDSFFNK